MKIKDVVIISMVVCITTVGEACKRTEKKYDASGTFETTEIIVSSEVNGQIMKMDMAEGAALPENQIVISIDSTSLVLKKQQLVANLNAIKARRTDISKQTAAVEEQIANAESEKKRIEQLLKADVATGKQLDDVNTQLAVLKKQRNAQLSSLQNTNQGIDQEAESLQIQIKQMEYQLEKCNIASPISGTVLVKYAEKGELATPGKPLFKIADMENMILRVYITSAQLTQLKLGQQVRVFADFGQSGKREYQGAIAWIASKSEFTPKTIQTQDERDNLVYAVKIAVKNDAYLKIGMYGEIKLTVE
jgi:HlyD family secretion protein